MKKYLGIIKKEIFLTLLTGALLSFITSLLVLLPGYLIDNYEKGVSFVVKLVLIYFFAFSDVSASVLFIQPDQRLQKNKI
jgi:hypothetical protein